MTKVPDHQKSSGNVFADLGLANAPELQAKAELAWEIAQIIEERGYTQAEAATRLGIDQPKVSALIRGRLVGFSMERLYRFLNALGKDVEIVVRSSPRPASEPGVYVVVPDRKAPAAKRSAPKRKAKRGVATR